jgi:hypothetical protein
MEFWMKVIGLHNDRGQRYNRLNSNILKLFLIYFKDAHFLLSSTPACAAGSGALPRQPKPCLLQLGATQSP